MPHEPVRKSRLMSRWVADISTHLRHGNVAGALRLQAPLPKWWSLSLKCCSQSRRPSKGGRGCLRLFLGAGVFRSFKGFAMQCSARRAQRGRPTWGMGWRALEEPKEGWGFDGQHKAFRCGEGLAIGGRLVRLCVSSVTPAVAVEEGWRCAVEWGASFRPIGPQDTTAAKSV